MKTHIVGGTGAMGSWLKNFLESQNLKVSVSGKTKKDNTSLKQADIVFISVPISVAPQVIEETAETINSSALLVDLSSSKSQTSQSLLRAPNPSVGIHLLFGPTVSTIQNQKIIFVRIKSDQKVDLLKKLFENSGAQVFELSVVEHEKNMAYLQSLIHFVNIVLGKTLVNHKIDLTKISTPVTLAQTSSIARVLAQNPQLLTEIQLGNPFTKIALQKYMDNAQSLLQYIEKGNAEAFENAVKLLNKKFTPQRSERKSYVKKSKTFKLPKQRLKLGFLGPQGTYSHQASQQIADQKYHKLIPYQTIYDIFQAVSNNAVDFGIVPAENSTEGTVRETLDFLVEFDLISNGMVAFPVHHYLLSSEKSLNNIKKVASHAQALGQCRNWLSQNLPKAKLEQAASTLSELEKHSKEKYTAFIGSKLAAKLYDLNILAENIGDFSENITKFYVISKKNSVLKIESGKTLLFLTVFNRVGVLRDILSIIASFNINLTNIESRPSHEKMWDYYFFAELDIPVSSQKLTEVLNILKQYCPVIKVLGSV